MIVKELMTSNVRTVKPGDSVELVAEIMRSDNVGIIPVCDAQNHLLGLITDRDIIIRQGYGKTAAEIMSTTPITASSKNNVHDAAVLFSKNGVRRLPIVDGEKLVGILSLKDLADKKIFTAEIGHIIFEISNFDKKL